MRGRYETLDSLRGLTAAGVLVRHLLLVAGLPAPPMQWAVILFFVLSGFVLAQPWVAERPPRWAPFLLRRLFRLWPPMLAAAALSAGLSLVVRAQPPFISSTWAEPLDAGLAVRCILMTGQHGGCTLAVPMWSLVFEARASLLFPLLVAYARLRPVPTAIVAVAWAVPMDFKGQMLSADGFLPGLVLTAHYLGVFIFGILLALYGKPLIRRLRPATALPAAAVLCALPYDTAEAVGGVLLIGVAIGSPRFARLLVRAPALWLGRISYSLYLVHWPLIMAAYYLLGGRMTAPGAGLVIATSLLLAYAMNRLIEQPAIAAGRRLTSDA